MSNNTPSKRRSRGHDLKAINWVRDDVRGLSLYERVLMQYLASKCNTDGTHSCFPEQRTIAADLEIDRRTVIRYLKSLEDKGLISKKRRPNTSCKYILHVSGSDSQMILPEVTGDVTPGSDSQIHHKEGTISKEVEVKNLEISVEKKGETSNDVTLGKKQGKVKKEHQEKEQHGQHDQERSDAMNIAAKYHKADPTRTVMVGYWFALMRRFHPDYPMLGNNLNKPQYKHLSDVFKVHGDQAYYVVAAAVCDWRTASEFARRIEGLPKDAIPKLGPTPTFINNASTGFAHYQNKHWQQATKQIAIGCNGEAA